MTEKNDEADSLVKSPRPVFVLCVPAMEPGDDSHSRCGLIRELIPVVLRARRGSRPRKGVAAVASHQVVLGTNSEV